MWCKTFSWLSTMLVNNLLKQEPEFLLLVVWWKVFSSDDAVESWFEHLIQGLDISLSEWQHAQMHKQGEQLFWQ